MRNRSTYPALVPLAVAAALLLYSGCEEPKKLKTEQPHIIFLLIDALRKDHMSCYGYHRETTPVMDELAGRGVVFEHAIAQSPWTAPSMASLFTSKRPLAVGVHATEQPGGLRHLKKGRVTKLDNKHTTLAEILKAKGYATIAVTTNAMSSHHVNMVQGFDRHTYLMYKKANILMDQALMDIAQVTDPESPDRGKPIFLYMHFIDVHEPNNPAHPFDKLYPTLDSRPHIKKHSKWGFYRISDPNKWAFRNFKSHKTALYDGALSFVDDQIGRLIDCLKEMGLFDNSIFVISSDHGEELWDHALLEQTYRIDPRGHYGVGHGHTMFAEVLDVPLIFYGPGVPGGVRTTEQVRNMDIAPTLLGLAGVNRAGLSLDGVDLIEKMKARTLTDLLAFSEDITYGYEEKCVQDARIKYIRGRNFEFLFDKKKDPKETINLVKKRRSTRLKYSKILDAILEGTQTTRGTPVIMTEELKEQLRHLGYME